MTEIVRLDESFTRWEDLLTLILSSFAYMDGVIDPPSSAHRLTPASLAQKARDEIAFVAEEDGKLAGCVFLKPEPGCLYVGKLAISPAFQSRGIGRQLLSVAEDIARQRGLPALRLETRIELTGNHTTFARWGFVKTAENAHAGYARTTSIEMRKRLSQTT
ncbi:GNAT family N-acetyltransferase [Rhizobium sp. CFBP 8752]|jgi:N-acetylglutamate synthase-like GNAT family acetyltransferase|uniref:GNAT family N-acetyltransferase n=1 Tax=Rhizobium sp. CFBP 8752 TaxID=2775301 RepID=UPI00177DB84D|nr:GNAT family N-acetyltransferase [Rhizobium sp. CFBP 8752]MBD8665138.1 GNAT family N-acetyltransferase [Rhizobium sp. CFBP 8752]